MLQKQKIATKIVVLILIIVGLTAVELFLLSYSLKEYHSVVKIGLVFIQSWLIILCGFFIFNTFKQLRLPPKYYKIRKIENEKFYDNLFVSSFQLILVKSFFRHLNKRVYLKGRKKEYIETFYKETKQSETSHLFSLVITLFIQGLYLYYGEFLLFVYLTVFSVLFNLYPALLQRKNRMVFELKYPKFQDSNS